MKVVLNVWKYQDWNVMKLKPVIALMIQISNKEIQKKYYFILIKKFLKDSGAIEQIAVIMTMYFNIISVSLKNLSMSIAMTRMSADTKKG